MQTLHDLIGIGFGPSNIALAIALEERRPAGGRRLDTCFIERQPAFAWHPNMMLDSAHMQISFLKDLATPRNPSSPFTFINYLHQKQRLPDFINLKTFYPSRHEFNDYLSWAAAHFDDRCHYGEEVQEVLPGPRSPQGTVDTLLVRSRDASGRLVERRGRHLVMSVGGVPNIPADFAGLRGDPRVFHSHHYLQSIAALPAARRIAIVGAGQSAAELFMDLHGRPQGPQVDLIMRARAIKPSDDSPFVNEIFNAEFTDFVFSRSEDERAQLMSEFWHTNYAAPDLDLIQQLYGVLYQQRVTGEQRHRFLRHHGIEAVRSHAEGIELTCRDLTHHTTSTQTYDAVILATGYRRDQHARLLDALGAWLPEGGELKVDRHYRVQTRPELRSAIFLQGACEPSHGLSDTLLSVTAIRTGEIRDRLLQLDGLDSAPSGPTAPARRSPQGERTVA